MKQDEWKLHLWPNTPFDEAYNRWLQHKCSGSCEARTKFEINKRSCHRLPRCLLQRKESWTTMCGTQAVLFEARTWAKEEHICGQDSCWQSTDLGWAAIG
jgi:hypothetical protein